MNDDHVHMVASRIERLLYSWQACSCVSSRLLPFVHSVERLAHDLVGECGLSESIDELAKGVHEVEEDAGISLRASMSCRLHRVCASSFGTQPGEIMIVPSTHEWSTR